MRKKTETAIKVLNEKIEHLEEKLNFLLNHDRNDVVLNVPALMGYNLTAKYIDSERIMNVKIAGCFWAEGGLDGMVFALPNNPKVIENTDEKFVVKVENKDNLFTPRYYRVIRYSGEVADVTEYYKQEEPTTDTNPDTPTETDFTYFTAEQVRNMSHKEVRDNYSNIRKSMELW